MTPICATFSDFRLVKGRKVCQLVCEVPLEQADAALAALGGLPNPHAERWVGIVALKEQPQGINSGSAPTSPADAADSPAAASSAIPPDVLRRLSAECAAAIGGSTEVVSIFGPSGRHDDHSAPQAQARGAAEPATKPKKHWDDLKPSQQAGMACSDARFIAWAKTRQGSSGLSSSAEVVRWYCGVQSRAELDTNPEAAKRWRDLYGMFQADTQYGDRR